MKNKKKGFTIIELILAILITVIILSTILTIFIVSTKIFTNVDVKSTLQSEAQTAQEKISKVGMQAIKINKITLVNGNIENFGANSEKSYNQLTDLLKDVNGNDLTGTEEDSEKYLNIKDITIEVLEEVPGPTPTEKVSYTIKYEATPDRDSDKTKPRGNLTIRKEKINEKWQPIGEDVESITMKPGNPSGKLSQVDSVEFTINLAKKRGFSDVKYSIPINVTFRNKTSY